MTILGIDEVGRGPWAGPLVIGAVILPSIDFEWKAKLTDSKKLTAKRRQELNEIILSESPATALGWISSKELDQNGMANALRLATRRAVTSIQKQRIPFEEIIIDGTVNFLANTALSQHVTVLKKADFLIKEVSAASIIAKVARDDYMIQLAKKYPNYGFEKHVGYGTALHQKAIEQYGIIDEHRRSFKPIMNFLGLHPDQKSDRPTTKQIGDTAENQVADFLIEHGHQIVARNFKTRFYEIDIISVKNQEIIFTEVKYRRDADRGGAISAVTTKKKQQMVFAAESFLKYQPFLLAQFSPRLAVATVSGHNFKIEDWFTLDS